MKNAVAPQVGKVIQSKNVFTSACVTMLTSIAALLKLSEETDLDILNHCMEAMVETYQTELLPVAADLTARLVCVASSMSIYQG